MVSSEQHLAIVEKELPFKRREKTGSITWGLKRGEGGEMHHGKSPHHSEPTATKLRDGSGSPGPGLTIFINI